MKKTVFTFLVTGLLISGLKAQTIQEGKTHFYAQRYNSARAVFDKILAANPNNIDAIYWLGQTLLETEEIAGARRTAARQLYEKGLQTSANAPLLLVGMGHVELLENKNNEARQRFETALTMTRTRKGDDPVILTAIGRANVNAKNGDFNYAIQKLTAAVDKGEKNAEMFLELGNAYRKAKPGEGGGDAYKSYHKALEIDPKFAPASLRLAQLFQSQQNSDLVLQYLNEAVAKDPKFTAGYYELFYYYFYRLKLPEAEAQLNKYIDSKLPEKDIADEYLYAQLCWQKKDFDCAVTKAESVVASLGANTKPKVYRLLGDAYFQKKDYTNAKKYSDEFFAKKNPDDINSFDYKLKADILAQTGGDPDEILNTYLQGAVLDTVLTSRIDFLKQGAESFKAKGDSISFLKEGDLRVAILKLKTEPSQRDYFDAGYAYYLGSAYPAADSFFAIISAKYPDDIYGPQMQFAIARLIDTTMEKGLAVPHGIRYLSILEKDTAKNKKAILSTAGYLAQYYANIEKDNAKAIEYFKKMLSFNPENADVLQKYIDQLSKTAGNKPSTTPKGTPPPKKVNKSVTKLPGAHANARVG